MRNSAPLRNENHRESQMSKKPLHIFVLAGGDSDEREISLQSGKNIAETLKQEFKVTHLEWSGDFFELSDALKKAAPHCIFNALHGGTGENGAIQGLFEVPTAKARFSDAGLLTPQMTLLNREAWEAEEPFERPYVLKPVAGGSSIGVTIVKEGDKLPPPPVLESEDVFMAEKYIKGREISVGIVNGKPIGITEICPPEGEFYDYIQKYAKGGARHITPAPLSPTLNEQAQQIAVTAYLSLGCKSAARVDMRLDEDEQQIWVLELNTQPGMTEKSLMPEMAQVRGLTFLSLLKNILREALGAELFDPYFT